MAALCRAVQMLRRPGALPCYAALHCETCVIHVVMIRWKQWSYRQLVQELCNLSPGCCALTLV